MVSLVRSLERRGKAFWLLPVLVLVMGLTVCIWFWQHERQSYREALRVALESAADQAVIDIDNKLRSLQVVMRGIQGYFHGSDDVSLEEFRAYVDALQADKHLSGITGIAFIELLRPEAIQTHQLEMSGLYQTSYEVFPPGSRSLYAPVTFIEPHEPENAATLGFDVLTVSEASEAMRRAVESDDVSISRRIILHQDRDRGEVFGFVMYLPVYYAHLPRSTVDERLVAVRGWVDVPSRMNDLMAGLQRELDPRLRLEIHDGEPGSRSLMYPGDLSASEGDQYGQAPGTRRIIEHGGRQWTLLMNSTDAFEANVLQRDRTLLILVVGSLLSLALASLVWLAGRARYSAELRFHRLFEQTGTMRSEHQAREERIQFLSNYDPLTQLPNRQLLHDRIQLALATAQRTASHVSLMFIDLNRFKIINESLGPSAGDELLQSFSRRLSRHLQADQTLCRQGGDDFILLLPGINAEDATQVARQLLQLTGQPYTLRGQRLTVTASIGIAVFPEDASDAESLTQAAEAALFRAKKSGPNNFQFFQRQMHEQATEILRTEAELREAIEQGQLLLHYQPQVNVASGTIVGLEALVRWQHPQRGLIPPGQFIPVAEECGLILSIGNWVLRETIRQIQCWQAEDLPVVPVAINLSAMEFQQDDFYESIVHALRESKLAPELLELELTESIVMENSERTIKVLEQLHALGVSLAIDDFGVGYSSLSYLKRFRINTLKIDQSFVRGVGKGAEDEAIITAIIRMAKALGFKTLAEGVEAEEQLDYLRLHACDEVQGYLFSPPVDADTMAAMLRDTSAAVDLRCRGASGVKP